MKDYFKGIEIFRVFAILAVIAIHTSPFSDKRGVFLFWEYDTLANFIKGFSSFAVPYFFIVSGFLYGLKTSDLPSDFIDIYTRKRLKKLLILFLSWSFVYLLPYHIYILLESGVMLWLKYCCWHVLFLIKYPIKTILEGSSTHLWFLNTLIWAVFITWICIRKKAKKVLLICSTLLYLFCFFKLDSFFSINNSYFNLGVTYGHICGISFFVFGYFLFQKELKIHKFGLGIALCLLGIIFILLQINGWVSDETILNTKLIMSSLLGTGASFLALSINRFYRLQFISSLGRFTLGIYCIHMIYIYNINELIDVKINNVIWEIFYPFIVYFLSFVSVLFLMNFEVFNLYLFCQKRDIKSSEYKV